MSAPTLTRLARRDADARARAKVARDALLEAIDAAYVAGATLGELAEATGLSYQRIHQLVTRDGGPGSRRGRKEAA